MPKAVLDVGNCDPDHSAIRQILAARFDVQVTRAHGMTDALSELGRKPYDLVLINRRMDRDGSSGLAIVQAIKSDPQLAQTPVVLISNFAESQQEAVAAGALPGFGKANLHARSTTELLSQILE